MSNETSEALNAPQTGAQPVDPRALILDTISTALNRAGFWLAIEGRRAIADAVLEQAGKDRAAIERVRAVLDQWSRNTLMPGQPPRILDDFRAALNE